MSPCRHDPCLVGKRFNPITLLLFTDALTSTDSNGRWQVARKWRQARLSSTQEAVASHHMRGKVFTLLI
eukprot:4955736-Amphidinium_carterae.1